MQCGLARPQRLANCKVLNQPYEEKVETATVLCTVSIIRTYR